MHEKFKIIIKACVDLLNDCSLSFNHKKYIDSRLSAFSQDTFEFGYFPVATDLHVLIDLIGQDILIDTKLIKKLYIDNSNMSNQQCFNSFFESHNLVMPYYNHYGKIIGMVGRTLLSDNERKENKIAKYKNTIFQKGKHLFNFEKAKSDIIKENCVYITEGQIDAIRIYEGNIKNVIALGSTSMSSYQLSIINRYCDKIYLLLDNDEAGESGVKKIKENFNQHIKIKNISLPEGYKDVDEFISQNSYDIFINYLHNYQ